MEFLWIYEKKKIKILTIVLLKKKKKVYFQLQLVFYNNGYIN
jgi:hypothetical protein